MSFEENISKTIYLCIVVVEVDSVKKVKDIGFNQVYVNNENIIDLEDKGILEKVQLEIEKEEQTIEEKGDFKVVVFLNLNIVLDLDFLEKIIN